MRLLFILLITSILLSGCSTYIIQDSSNSSVNLGTPPNNTSVNYNPGNQINNITDYYDNLTVYTNILYDNLTIVGVNITSTDNESLFINISYENDFIKTITYN